MSRSYPLTRRPVVRSATVGVGLLAVAGPSFSSYIDVTTVRLIEDRATRACYAAIDKVGDVCLIGVLPGKNAGMSCTRPDIFHSHDLGVSVRARDAGSLEGYLVPDAAAGESNIVHVDDYDIDPEDQLAPDAPESFTLMLLHVDGGRLPAPPAYPDTIDQESGTEAAAAG